MREPAAEEAVAARDGVGGGAGGGPAANSARIAAASSGVDPLVRVQAQHPVVARLPDREVLLRPEALPRVHDDARAEARGDRCGIIAAARIDDDRLRRERNGRETVREFVRGIARNDHQRQGKRFGHAPEEGRDGFPPILRGLRAAFDASRVFDGGAR